MSDNKLKRCYVTTNMKCYALERMDKVDSVINFNVILADPTLEEERLSSGGRITVVTNGMQLYSVHKPGGSALSESELQMCINLANGRAEQMNKLIETAINTSGSKE